MPDDGRKSKDQKYQFFSIDQLARLPKPEWLIDGIIGKGQLAILTGDPGVGKTFLGLDMALSVASGKAWQDRKVREGSILGNRR